MSKVWGRGVPGLIYEESSGKEHRHQNGNRKNVVICKGSCTVGVFK